MTVGDLSYGFDLLRLKHSTRQAQAFLLSHDLKRDGYLSYPELQTALAPQTPQYADILFSRYPIDLYAIDRHQEKAFLPETLVALKTLLKLMVD